VTLHVVGSALAKTMTDYGWKRKVTKAELLGLACAAIVIFGPLLLVLAFPQNRVVQTLFGGRRPILILLILGIGIWSNRERVNRFVERIARRFFHDE
jgi:hypothetical protein